MRVRLSARRACAGALALAGLMPAANPAFADKPDWAGGGRGKGGAGNKGGGPKGGDINIDVDIRFGGGDRLAVRDYFNARGCPPGLAKKSNGCLPPGQAKKWAVGHPLPRDVISYDLPHELVIKLRPPPAGYRYVRVAADLLMIAVGTGLVIDAIEDLGRL
ncbi:RcnB family protein [Desertibaculum subflavum]|uniref:RcnB family protein n=1 Tax=Desertibaculum subflavum TaxID=2268458 RepID=UPI000E67593E